MAVYANVCKKEATIIMPDSIQLVFSFPEEASTNGYVPIVLSLKKGDGITPYSVKKASYTRAITRVATPPVIKPMDSGDPKVD
jgi:hypothetical protein